VDQLIKRHGAGLLPDVLSDIPSVFAHYAKAQPDHAAILASGRPTLSFAGLYAQLESVRDRVAAWGLRRGDPVALVLPKGPDCAVATAVLPASVTVVPLDPRLTEPDYARLIQRSGAKALILPEGQAHTARRAADAAGLFQIDLVSCSDAPAGSFTLRPVNEPPATGMSQNLGPECAYIFGTSGTTSERKLVPVSHNHMVVSAQATKAWYGLGADDLGPQLTPLYFAQGIKATLMSPLLSGTSIVCGPAYQADGFFCPARRVPAHLAQRGFRRLSGYFASCG
jgi:acyl-CoA synthetase (AMP-forming)/AMP-acid ligase II